MDYEDVQTACNQVAQMLERIEESLPALGLTATQQMAVNKNMTAIAGQAARLASATELF